FRLYILFTCDRPSHLLYLHSFPTRRSSDLIEYPDRLIRFLARLTILTGSPISRTKISPPCARVPACMTSLDASGIVIQAGTLAQDRKSTRLNSSHVSISYAVFCLKKKRHYN